MVRAIKDPSDGARPSITEPAYACVASGMDDTVGLPAVVIAAEARPRAAVGSSGGTA